MGTEILYQQREWLYEEYVVKKRSVVDIGNQFGVTGSAVKHYVQKFKLTNQRRLDIHNLTCPNCKTEFTLLGSEYSKRLKGKSDTRIFCSKECARIAHKEFMTGRPSAKRGQKYKPLSDEHKLILSIKSKEYAETIRETGELEERMSLMHKARDEYFSTSEGYETRRRGGVNSTLSQAGKRETSIERSVRELLDRLGVTYFKQVDFKYYVVDFYIPIYGVVVEVQGDYWHGNPGIYTNLNATQRKNVTRDKRKRTFLRNRGYTLLELWETDIRRSPDDCLNRIRELLDTGTDVQHVGSF